MLLKPELLDQTRPEWFYLDSSMSVYNAILQSKLRFGRVDPLSVSEAMGGTSEEKAAARTRLSGIIERAEQVEEIKPYAQILTELSSRRRRVQSLEEALAAVRAGADDELVRRLVDQSRPSGGLVGVRSLAACRDDALVALDRLRDGGVDLTTGYQKLDLCLGGLRRGLLYTVGGKTSQGKTTVAANLIRNNLHHNQDTVIIYDGFENIEQILLRLSAIESGVKLDHYLKPWLYTKEQYDKARAAMANTDQWKDRLVIAYRQKVRELREVCKTRKPGIVLVDFLQRYAHTSDMDKEGRLSYEIGRAVSDMQDMAIEFNLAVVLFSQLRRTSEEQRGRRPEIGDLKESGDIENYSDVILMLYWPWRDTLDQHKNPNEYQILVRKNKLGPCEDISLYIDPETLKLSDWMVGRNA